MNRKDIRDRILLILEKDIVNRPLPTVNGDDLLGDDGIGLDSLNFLKFLTALEKEFKIEIEDDYWDYKRMCTISKLIDYFYLQEVK